MTRPGAPMASRYRRQALRLGTAAAGCALLIAACGDSPAPREQNRAEAEVRRDYLAYWDAWLAASAASDPDLPDLSRHAASRQLAMLRANLRESAADGTVTKGSVGHDIRSVTHGEQTSFVTDCVDLDDWVIHDRASGKPVKQLLDRPSQLATYTLAVTEHGWLVTDSTVVDQC